MTIIRHLVGQLVHLAHREGGAFVRLFLTSATDPAGIARDDPVIGRSHQHRPSAPVKQRLTA